MSVIVFLRHPAIEPKNFYHVDQNVLDPDQLGIDDLTASALLQVGQKAGKADGLASAYGIAGVILRIVNGTIGVCIRRGAGAKAITAAPRAVAAIAGIRITLTITVPTIAAGIATALAISIPVAAVLSWAVTIAVVATGAAISLAIAIAAVLSGPVTVAIVATGIAVLLSITIALPIILGEHGRAPEAQQSQYEKEDAHRSDISLPS